MSLSRNVITAGMSSLSRKKKLLWKILIRTSVIVALFQLTYLLFGFKRNALKTQTWEGTIRTGKALAALPTKNDTRLLALKIQQHQKIFNTLYGDESLIVDKATKDKLMDTLNTLETIYPINKDKFGSIWNLYSTFKGRGIVMTTGKYHFKYALHTINVLQRLDCKLPIEIFYNGEEDLTPKMINTLKNKNGVKLIDAKTFVLTSKENSIGGWAIKPFAMLMSSFQEFVFLDADVLFFQNPEKMFDFQSYRETGTLYFRDRTIGGGNDDHATLDYLLVMAKKISKYGQTQRIWKRLSAHEGESGVIVMDKKKGGLFVLLLATLLNMDPFQQDMYEVIHGDKESYWMSNEALDVPYRWGPGAGGTVGYPNPNNTDSICGQLFHVDENWKPLWLNGGVVMNKHSDYGKNTLMPITHFAVDSSFKDIDWEWETDAHPFCLKPSDSVKESGELSKEFLGIGQMMVHEWLLLDLPDIDQ